MEWIENDCVPIALVMPKSFWLRCSLSSSTSRLMLSSDSVPEDTLTTISPLSSYWISKLIVEHWCLLYPTVLRTFKLVTRSDFTFYESGKRALLSCSFVFFLSESKNLKLNLESSCAERCWLFPKSESFIIRLGDYTFFATEVRC